MPAGAVLDTATLLEHSEVCPRPVEFVALLLQRFLSVGVVLNADLL